MCFAARSIRDENYKNEKEKDGEMERERTTEEGGMRGLDAQSPLPEGLIENRPRSCWFSIP